MDPLLSSDMQSDAVLLSRFALLVTAKRLIIVETSVNFLPEEQL